MTILDSPTYGARPGCGAALDSDFALPVVPPFPFATEPAVADAACGRHDNLVRGVVDDANDKVPSCSANARAGLPPSSYGMAATQCEHGCSSRGAEPDMEMLVRF